MNEIKAQVFMLKGMLSEMPEADQKIAMDAYSRVMAIVKEGEIQALGVILATAQLAADSE